MKTTCRCYRIDRRQIGYFKFILEGYDNAAVLTTLDANKGIVRVTIPSGCEAIVDNIIHHLAAECGLILLPDEIWSGETPKKRIDTW